MNVNNCTHCYWRWVPYFNPEYPEREIQWSDGENFYPEESYTDCITNEVDNFTIDDLIFFKVDDHNLYIFRVSNKKSNSKI